MRTFLCTDADGSKWIIGNDTWPRQLDDGSFDSNSSPMFASARSIAKLLPLPPPGQIVEVSVSVIGQDAKPERTDDAALPSGMSYHDLLVGMIASGMPWSPGFQSQTKPEWAHDVHDLADALIAEKRRREKE